MKVNVFAAQVHVEDLVLAHIEQNLINGNVQCKTDKIKQEETMQNY